VANTVHAGEGSWHTPPEPPRVARRRSAAKTGGRGGHPRPRSLRWSGHACRAGVPLV